MSAFETEARGAGKLSAEAEEGIYSYKGDDAFDDDGLPKRTGTWTTATGHWQRCAQLGWAIAQMGWIFGPLSLLAFSVVTWYCAQLLADAYRVGDEFTGKRNHTYMQTVQAYLGPVNVIFCGIVQYLNLYATGVGYTVTGSLSLVAVKKATCFHNNPEDSCLYNNNPWMIFFGAMQILFSQVPNFGELWWLSYVATTMSFLYASIGLGLSIGKATQSGHPDYGTAWGTADDGISSALATWNIFVGLGSCAFAYSFSLILIEIQDTVSQTTRSGKVVSEASSMKKATKTSIIITTFFYMSIGCISYAGFGDTAPGNLLTGFGFYNPYWLVGAANVFVWIHLIGAYQVFMQPFMAFVESSVLGWFPNSAFLRIEKKIPVPGFGHLVLSPLKLVLRTTIVISTTIIALLLPFFNDIVGFLGALGFWPLTVHFPVEMAIVARKIRPWSGKWIALRLLSLVCFLITMAAAIGSIAYVILDTKSYKPFHSIS